jgi:hypothetical protein
MTGYEASILTPPEPRVTECPYPGLHHIGCGGRDFACADITTCDIYAEDARCNAADAAHDARKEDGL